MTSQIKSGSAQLYHLRYSKIILKLEITFVMMMFVCQLALAKEIWLPPSLFLSAVIGYIYFSKFSITTQFPQGLCCQFRTAPDRLIWYDSAGESTFLIEDMDIRITRWFVLLTLANESNRLHRVLLKDSFENMKYYTDFRRQLLNNNNALAK